MATITARLSASIALVSLEKPCGPSSKIRTSVGSYNSKTQPASLLGGSTTNATCSAITAQGRTQRLPCHILLPALCHNSAALISPESTNSSSKWQTAVTTGNATIVGYRDKHSFRFQGIKYASIPSRFSDSAYLPPAGENISALSYGPQCMQGSYSETQKKAVMVWFHGGGFVSGSGSDTTFDGGAISSRGDVILVTVNYRLGYFGLLALEGTSLAGNYALKDQNTALDWLHAHIDAFGGDRDKITIFGQSAGAASVRALLASPKTRDKFAGAITQSTSQGMNYASTFSHYLTISEATNRTKSLLSETGCASASSDKILTCLQAVDPLKLTTGSLNVNLLSGVMHDDGSPFTTYPSSTNLTAALLEQSFPVSTILNSSLFPLPANPNTTLAIFNLTSRVATDTSFRCLAQSTASTASKNSIFKKSYAYEFDRAFQILSWSPNAPAYEAPHDATHPSGNPALPYYKCHSGELYFVFGTLVREGGVARDDDDVRFSQYVLDSWTAFARTGNPTPDMEFLEERGFGNTSALVRGLEVLDVEPRDEGWREVLQCDALGFGLGYYDV
ncbi:alpha/beta-hydrolase [Lizonia empirigonia]|nr:alpha/beta-hydrolase [Lizonia empirigonia]